MRVISRYSSHPLSDREIRTTLEKGFRLKDWSGKKILLIVPDSTRSGPFGDLIRLVLEIIKPSAKRIDILIALGTHPPLSKAHINSFLGIKPSDRNRLYKGVRIFNHRWDRKSSLKTIGTISSKKIHKSTKGLFNQPVRVEINRLIFNYDELVVLGPVFPHEIVGFSGGLKYFFPGISGPAFLNFFHWVGAMITNIRINGVIKTPVRELIHQAAKFIGKPQFLVALDIHAGKVAGIFMGDIRKAWLRAARRSSVTHIRKTPKRYSQVIGIAPSFYTDLWTAGKVMFKLESIVKDGGELVIFAPHIRETSRSHGHLIDRIGYHVRDYFLSQWDRFKKIPWGVLAHSTHVKGAGTYSAGLERPRIKVVLATGITEKQCLKLNLSYMEPKSIKISDYENREEKGILVVKNAGEILYRFRNS
jgi:lactate racemase